MSEDLKLHSFTAKRCPELAAFLESCCSQPLSFEGDCPNYHSYLNHIHLWALEYWADRHAWIDLTYRTAFVELIFQRWRGRLKGLEPYRNSGYRFYLYEWMAPTVSVVAETPSGFPYPGKPIFVKSPRDVMRLFIDRSWAQNFDSEPWQIPRDKVLRVIETNSGSISKPSADALGLRVGALRTLIEQMGLDRQVNAIRKQFKRRPARFRVEPDPEFEFACYELRLPANYR